MPHYTRRQLALLLLLVAAAGAGIAVGRWRAAHPDLVARVERLDRVDPPPAPAAPPPRVAPRPARVPRPPRLGTEAAAIDVNHAGVDELRRVPGVGPVLAARIVESRESDGAFGSVDDLRRVRGVGPVRLERLRPFVRTGT